MKLKPSYYLGVASAILLAFVSSVGAASLTGVSLGTGAPPGTLGTWSMTPNGADPSAVGSLVSSVGSVTFNQAMTHDQIGNGWGTWSHGYAGDVYDTADSLNPTSLTLTLGAGVRAFDFYVEPVNFADFTFTATTLDGTTLSQIVNGNGGAWGFGFYTTGLDYITSVTVTGTDTDGFAIGEFGLNQGSAVPEGGYSFGYLLLGLMALGACRYVFLRRRSTAKTACLAGFVALGLMLIPEKASAAPWDPGTDSLGVGLSPVAFGSIDPFVTESGFVYLSVDGLGILTPSGNIRVNKPSINATVRKAYLLSASTGFTSYRIPNGGVTLAGTPVNWDTETPSNIRSYNYLADVTAIIKPILDAAPAGINLVAVIESNTAYIDGEILAVIFDDPNQTSSSTVVLLFGAQKVAGDTFNITLSDPIDLSKPDLVLDMSLGISFGYQTPSTTVQYSIVTVNGSQLTQSAGGQDDGQAANGALITVGGIGDSIANPPPFGPVQNYNTDDELYSLIPFVHNGDTTITVFTRNPSGDDNIFFSALVVSGGAIVNEGILLSPLNATNQVGTTHTVTATVEDNNGNPVANRLVQFDILSGPNAGLTASGDTDASGKVTFTYVGTGGVGVDTIEATMTDASGKLITSPTVLKTWVVSHPVLSVTPEANRGYYQLTATSGLYAAAQLQVYVKDSASAFVAGPYPSGTIVKIKKSAATGIGPASGPASVTINVLGDGQAYAVDPSAQVSVAVTCKSL